MNTEGAVDRQDHDVRAAPLLLLALSALGIVFGDLGTSSLYALQLATPALGPSVIPITACILVLLFAVQPFGSGRVGVLFGPILATWFVVIAILGASPPTMRACRSCCCITSSTIRCCTRTCRRR